MAELSTAAVGVVLAGGASRRFGRDKAVEPYRETTLAGWAARRLQAVVAEVLVADRGRGLLADLPSTHDLSLVEDVALAKADASAEGHPPTNVHSSASAEVGTSAAGPSSAVDGSVASDPPAPKASIPGAVPRSPAAGLLGAARSRPGRPLLVLACDLPSVPAELLRHLLRRFLEGNAAGRGAVAVVPRHLRGLEPLCALYAPAALDLLRDRVEQGHLALYSWVEALGSRVLWVGEDEIGPFGPAEEVFRNVNRPRDLP